MKVLVTGGAGFIGSHVADLFINKGHRVVIVDNLSRGKIGNVNKKAKFYKVDICNKELENVFKTFKPDIVNHQAAMINVRESVDIPLKYEKNNILGLVNILENCRKHSVKKIINISSGGVVYGDPKKLPPTEDVPFDPQSPYGITKVEGEYWVRYYRKQFGLNFTSLRYANVYGPRQSTVGGAGVIAIFAKSMLASKQPIIFGKGNIARDYVYISDVARANYNAANLAKNEAINIATGKYTTVKEIFDLVKKEISYAKEPKYEAEKPGEVKINYLDIKKAKKYLSWSPQIKLKDGIARTVEYFKEN